MQISEITKKYTILALYGTNGFTEEHEQTIKDLKNLKEVILFFDGDDPGTKAASKLEKEIKVIIAKEDISFGFKVALTTIAKDEHIYKYGESIGKASKLILKGQLVHIHNVEGFRGRGDLVKGEV